MFIKKLNPNQFYRSFLISIIISLVANFNLFAAENEKEDFKKAQEDFKKAIVLQDLAYGNILFEYYRGEPIKALNAILVAEKKNLLPNHRQSARLLSGVIYLELGMIGHAQNIFNELLTEDDLKSELLSRLEFYLSKIQYRLGEYQQAEKGLSKILDSLEPSLKDESLIMLSNIAVQNDEKEKARDLLLRVSKDSNLVAFSRYNLAVSFLREANLNEALKILNQLPQEDPPDLDNRKIHLDNRNLDNRKFDLENKKAVETQVDKSLQDKAKIALGYFYLSENNYPKAREVLLQVRLNSIESNRALLGMGWSYLGEKDYQKALSHWLELLSKDKRDLSVQEAFLAIPYVYQQLDAQQEALDGYLQASNLYQTQITLINELINEIETNGLVEKSLSQFLDKQILDKQSSDKRVSNKNEQELFKQGVFDGHFFGEKLSYYLFELLSQHQFNQDVIGYQQVQVLIDMLAYWQKQLPMFTEMLDVNKRRFEDKIPLVELSLSTDSYDIYLTKLVELEKDISNLKNNKKLYLLANEDELKLHNRMFLLKNKIAELPDKAITETQKITLKRAQGILQWQLESNKTEKIWELEKLAQQIRLLLSELDNRKNSLLNARESARNRFSGFDDKIQIGSGDLLDLSEKLELQRNNLIEQLKQKILVILDKRQSSLQEFILQSDLGVARMHGQSVIIPELN